jgi:DNA (cytosine-5)-methyltransferase 1
MPANRPAVVELFAGLGCVARAFEETGRFEAALLVDNDSCAVAACRDNSVGSIQLEADVRSLTADAVRDQLDGRRLAGLLGCPPCQGFSSAGPRNDGDDRNRLLAHFFRLIHELQPDFFVMENVPAVLRAKALGDALGTVTDFVIWKGVLNAALYGTPQTRQRAVLIGYRRGLGLSPSPPPPTHLGRRLVYDYQHHKLRRPGLHSAFGTLGLYAELGRPGRLDREAAGVLVAPEKADQALITVGEAIGDLLAPAGYEETPTKPSPYAKSLRLDGHFLANHEAWQHTEGLAARMALVDEGGLPASLHGRGRSRKYFSQAYGRLHRKGLARTITTNFHNPGAGRFTHYGQSRTITVREALRLQGLEDGFVLSCNRTCQERLAGNALPMPLARALARHVSHLLTINH